MRAVADDYPGGSLLSFCGLIISRCGGSSSSHKPKDLYMMTSIWRGKLRLFFTASSVNLAITSVFPISILICIFGILSMYQTVMLGTNGYNIQPMSLIIAIMVMILIGYFITVWILTPNGRGMGQSPISNGSLYGLMGLSFLLVKLLPFLRSRFVNGLAFRRLIILTNVLKAGNPYFWTGLIVSLCLSLSALPPFGVVSVSLNLILVTAIFTVGMKPVFTRLSFIELLGRFFLLAFGTDFCSHLASNRKRPQRHLPVLSRTKQTPKALDNYDSRILFFGQLLSA